MGVNYVDTKETFPWLSQIAAAAQKILRQVKWKSFSFFAHIFFSSHSRRVHVLFCIHVQYTHHPYEYILISQEEAYKADHIKKSISCCVFVPARASSTSEKAKQKDLPWRSVGVVNTTIYMHNKSKRPQQPIGLS